MLDNNISYILNVRKNVKKIRKRPRERERERSVKKCKKNKKTTYLRRIYLCYRV